MLEIHCQSRLAHEASYYRSLKCDYKTKLYDWLTYAFIAAVVTELSPVNEIK